MRTLILVAHWSKGFGVARVVGEQALRLAERGHHVTIGCLSCSLPAPTGVDLVQIPWKRWGLRWFIERGGWDHVIAHTQEFMEALHACSGPVRILYDHGEPPPRYFPQGRERTQREGLIHRRREVLAPAMDHVVCISEFMRSDLGLESAIVIHNGADHLEKPPSSTQEIPGDRFRLLCISRMGEGEREYKGLNDLARLAEDISSKWITTVAGRGTSADAEALSRPCLQVVLDPSDAELGALIQDCDALVSLSRWEGFNLPLVEAGMSGKPGYALDHGAHREVTPFAFGSLEFLRGHLADSTRTSLREDGRRMLEHVDRFRWDRNVDELESRLESWKRREPGRGSPILVAALRVAWALWQQARTWARREVRSPTAERPASPSNGKS